MAEFKLCIGTKEGKTVKKEIKDDEAQPLMGLRLGDTLNGEVIGLTGWEFKVSGGSDHCGFPMRRGINGNMRKRILTRKGIGFRAKKNDKRKGIVKRKTVCGDTIHEKISQINLTATKTGSVSLTENAE